MSLALLILFSSFVIQVYRNPFLPSGKVSTTSNVERGSNAAIVSFSNKVSNQYRFDYNLLESAYLICSIFLLLSGLVFESANVDYETGKQILALFVVLITISSSLLFVMIVGVELYRSIQFAKEKDAQLIEEPVDDLVVIKDNPLFPVPLQDLIHRGMAGISNIKDRLGKQHENTKKDSEGIEMGDIEEK